MPFPHSYIKLTEEELGIIRQEMERYALAGDFKKRNRLLILLFSHSGKSYQQITDPNIPGMANATVRYWLNRFRKDGLKPFIRASAPPALKQSKSTKNTEKKTPNLRNPR